MNKQMESKQVFIKLNNKNYPYHIYPDTNIIQIKREIAKKININPYKIYSMRLLHSGKQLLDHIKPYSDLYENATLHILSGLTSGPETQHFEQAYVKYKNKYIQVQYLPNDKVDTILKQVLEQLIPDTLPITSLFTDAYLTFGNKIDHNAFIAEFPELSPSFIIFNKQDDHIISKFSKMNIPINNDYYQFIALGERIKGDKELEFHLGNGLNHNYSHCHNNCKCGSPLYIIMPCCRNKACRKCFMECLNNIDNISCSFCNK